MDGTIEFYKERAKQKRRLVRVAPLWLRNKIGRALWRVVWLLFFRPTPRPLHAWRCLLLRAFGAKVGKAVHVYPTTDVWVDLLVA